MKHCAEHKDLLKAISDLAIDQGIIKNDIVWIKRIGSLLLFLILANLGIDASALLW